MDIMEILETKETEDWEMTIIYTPPNINRDLLLVEGEFNDGKNEETGVIIPLEFVLSEEDLLFERSTSISSSCYLCDNGSHRINFFEVCGKLDRPIRSFSTDNEHICNECNVRLSEKIQKQAIEAFGSEFTAHQL